MAAVEVFQTLESQGRLCQKPFAPTSAAPQGKLSQKRFGREDGCTRMRNQTPGLQPTSECTSSGRYRRLHFSMRRMRMTGTWQQRCRQQDLPVGISRARRSRLLIGILRLARGIRKAQRTLAAYQTSSRKTALTAQTVAPWEPKPWNLPPARRCVQGLPQTSNQGHLCWPKLSSFTETWCDERFGVRSSISSTGRSWSRKGRLTCWMSTGLRPLAQVATRAVLSCQSVAMLHHRSPVLRDPVRTVVVAGTPPPAPVTAVGARQRSKNRSTTASSVLRRPSNTRDCRRLFLAVAGSATTYPRLLRHVHDEWCRNMLLKSARLLRITAPRGPPKVKQLRVVAAPTAGRWQLGRLSQLQRAVHCKPQPLCPPFRMSWLRYGTSTMEGMRCCCTKMFSMHQIRGCFHCARGTAGLSRCGASCLLAHPEVLARSVWRWLSAASSSQVLVGSTSYTFIGQWPFVGGHQRSSYFNFRQVVFALACYASTHVFC